MVKTKASTSDKRGPRGNNVGTRNPAPKKQRTFSKSRKNGRSKSCPSTSIASQATRAFSNNNPAAIPASVARIMRQEEATCLSFGLCPGFKAHSKILCQRCYGMCLYNGWNTEKKKRAKRYLCERPWHPSRQNDNVEEVRKWYFIDFEHYLRILPEIIYLREGDISIFCLKKLVFRMFLGN